MCRNAGSAGSRSTSMNRRRRLPAAGAGDKPSMPGPISEFVDRHYRHFNAAALKDAADAYIRHMNDGGAMLLAMAGAMSTAEMGVSIAEMIRAGKINAISCTGANLEEDIFNLVARNHYERIPRYRELTVADEQKLLERHL